MWGNFLNYLSLIIGIIGLVATLAGLYFTYISFVNPIIRFKKYLKNPSDWEKFQGLENHISTYRHRKYPNFQIIIDWEHELVNNFHEEWINDALFPDKSNNSSHYVRLEANSMLLEKEMFVSLDGHRYFVPVPRRMMAESDKLEYYYDSLQIQLSNIVGIYHFGDKNIYDFAKNQKIRIAIKDK